MDGRYPPDAYGAFQGYPDARFEGRAADYYHGDEGRSERAHRMKDYDSGDERNGHEEDGPKKKKKKKRKEKGRRRKVASSTELMCSGGNLLEFCRASTELLALKCSGILEWLETRDIVSKKIYLAFANC